MVFFCVPASAGVWNIVPRASVAGIYTDNLDLEPENENSALIAEVTPGINIDGRGGRFEAYLDYQMQNFISSEFDNTVETAHQLTARSTTELSKQLLFFDANARAGQAIINANDTISLSNYNNNRNRTDVYSYTLSPYATPHFANYADGLFRYSYSDVLFSENSGPDNNRSSGASDSTVHNVDARLVNGSYFKQTSWFANYNFRRVDRQSNQDTTYESINSEARYRVSKEFSFVGQAGWYNDDLGSSNVDDDNGTYWAVGGFWQPSRYYSLEALTGRNLTTATAALYPTVRTVFRVTYRDREVGTNPGETWSGVFTHRTRRTNWRAGYRETTTTSQEEALIQEQGFLPIDPVTGEVVNNPQPGDNVVNVPLPPIVTLTDETQERKRAFGSVGVGTGKTGIRFNVFQEDRKFLESGDEETTRGFSGSWSWRFAPRTNWILTGSWQRIEPDNVNGNNNERDFWYIQPQLTRQIRTNLDGSLAYRYVKQTSDREGDEYDENSLIARITAYF